MGRDHSVECPECGAYYGGLLSPEHHVCDDLSDLEGGANDERSVIAQLRAELEAVKAERDEWERFAENHEAQQPDPVRQARRRVG